MLARDHPCPRRPLPRAPSVRTAAVADLPPCSWRRMPGPAPDPCRARAHRARRKARRLAEIDGAIKTLLELRADVERAP